jgi:hypothetical protein
MVPEHSRRGSGATCVFSALRSAASQSARTSGKRVFEAVGWPQRLVGACQRARLRGAGIAPAPSRRSLRIPGAWRGPVGTRNLPVHPHAHTFEDMPSRATYTCLRSLLTLCVALQGRDVSARRRRAGRQGGRQRGGSKHGNCNEGSRGREQVGRRTTAAYAASVYGALSADAQTTAQKTRHCVLVMRCQQLLAMARQRMSAAEASEVAECGAEDWQSSRNCSGSTRVFGASPSAVGGASSGRRGKPDAQSATASLALRWGSRHAPQAGMRLRHGPERSRQRCVCRASGRAPDTQSATAASSALRQRSRHALQAHVFGSQPQVQSAVRLHGAGLAPGAQLATASSAHQGGAVGTPYARLQHPSGAVGARQCVCKVLERRPSTQSATAVGTPCTSPPARTRSGSEPSLHLPAQPTHSVRGAAAASSGVGVRCRGSAGGMVVRGVDGTRLAGGDVRQLRARAAPGRRARGVSLCEGRLNETRYATRPPCTSATTAAPGSACNQ